MEKKLVLLNIAGQIHSVLFDGEKVTDTLFPEEKILCIPNPCGIEINQEMLVNICQQKLNEKTATY
jgi:hypothetical protein